MVEQSFPVLEKPLTDVQWSSITMGLGNGVIDERGNPYNLTDFSNVDNTAVVKVDTKTGYNHAVLNGFYHRMDEDIKVSFPAVSARTTYNVVLVYDPQNESMPVSLKSVKALDETGRKNYLELWRVTREPNQLLTNATVVKIRPTIAPYIQVDDATALPKVTSLPFGTRAHCLYTGETWRASYTWKPDSARIIPTLSMPGWDMEQGTKGVIVTPVAGGWLCNWSVGITRAAYSYPIPIGWEDKGGVTSTTGTPIPAGLRPISNVYSISINGNKSYEARLTPEGKLQIHSTTGNTETIYKGTRLDFTFTWYADESRGSRG